MQYARTAFVAIVCLGLVGCAATWVKPGASTADYNRDSYECEKDMRQSAYLAAGFLRCSI
jgi:hypothetical protein